MKRATLCYIRRVTRAGQREYLMLYRNKKKDDPNEGKWIGVGGKFEPGETPDECMLREVREETGLVLDPGEAELLFCWTGEFFLCDVYHVRREFAPATLTLQPGETGAARAASLAEIRSLFAAGQFVPWDYLDRLPDREK